MMHQFRDKKQITKRRKIIKNVIIFGFFFIISISGFLSLTGNFFNYIGKPIWKLEKLTTNSFHNINFLFKSKKIIFRENNNLIEENFRLRNLMIDYENIKNENYELKEVLNRLPEVNNFILGSILTKPNHSPYDTIVIDIGNNLGIKEGDKVFANGNIPIGVISKIYEKTSLVSLFTNPGQKTEGFIEGINASVELTGRGGGNFEMVIPIELVIEKGLSIYLPGSTPLILAFVDEVISKPSDPFKKVLLSSPVNIQNLKWVEVKK